MSRFCPLLFLLVSTLSSFRCLGEDAGVITFSDDHTILPIGKEIFLLEDKTDLLGIKEVISSNKFKKSTQDVPNLRLATPYWVRFQIRNLTNNKLLLLDLAYPSLDEVELYSILPDRKIKMERTGDLYPFSQRPYEHQNFIFDLTIPQNDIRTYFIKIKNSQHILIPISIARPKNLAESLLNQDLLVGILFGIYFIMCLYNLFIYFSTRDKDYLYYVIYFVFIALTQATILGYPARLFWTNSPWFNNQSLIFFVAIATITSVTFVTRFLNTKKYFPKLYAFSNIVYIPCSLCIILSIFNYPALSILIYDFTSIFFSCYILSIIIIAIRKGNRPARIILAGWSLAICGFIAFALKNLGWLPSNNFTNHTMQIGVAFEAALFSLALADRINVLKKENEDKQNKIINHLKEHEQNMLATKESELIIERLKKESLISQFESLKNQINPHFLFNSLNVLTELITQKPEYAIVFIKELADVYRYVLENKNKEVVELETELSFVKAFSYLLNIRYPENLKINIGIDNHINGILIPPLTLQMLIENSIKHNIISSQQPLLIEINMEEDYLVVKNNIQRKKISGIPSGIGLKNIESRYNFLTDKKIHVSDNGKYFIVKIPILKYQSN
jgi:sensor histidine kinase YesM